jgi:hypothetical protein
VELFRLFYSLRIPAGDQRSGCVSFLFGMGMIETIIPIKVSKKVEDFKKRWLYMDTRLASPLFLPPVAVAVKNSGWEQFKDIDEELALLMKRMRLLHAKGLMGQMVAKEFMWRRVAPPPEAEPTDVALRR